MTDIKYVSLEEILTEKQYDEFKKHIKIQFKKGLKPLDIEFINSLKELFNQWEDDLILVGILPDYLAYIVAYKISQGILR